MKEKDVPLAVPLQYFVIVYWEEPSLQRNVCISDFSSLAQLAFHKSTRLGHTGQIKRLDWLTFVRHRRHFQPWGCFQHKRFTSIYIYNIIVSLSKSGQDLYKRIMLSIFPGYIRHIPRVRSQRWAANLQSFDGHRDARGGRKPGDAVGWLRNPPVDRWFIPLFIGFQPSKVVQDFFHPQYVCTY